MPPNPPENPGKTIWEMLTDRLRAHSNGAGTPFDNPLDLRVGSPLAVAHANGPDFADYDFTVNEIREYNRHIAGQDLRFTDYVLRGLNRKSFETEDSLVARVRVVPNSAGGHTALLLRLFDEFAFAEGFLEVLKDDTGVFEVQEEDDGPKIPYSRINELRESYAAAVLIISATTPEGKAVSSQTAPLKIEYWDYWRDVDIGGGNTAKEFLFVEMNSDTGWFQIWRGREFYS